jgi:hypothetical protein
MGGGLQKSCKCLEPPNDWDPNVPAYQGPTSYVTRHPLDGGSQGSLCMDRWCCPENVSGQVVVPIQTPALTLTQDEKANYEGTSTVMSYPSQNQQHGQDHQAFVVPPPPDEGGVPPPPPSADNGGDQSSSNVDGTGKTASEWAEDQSQFAHLPPLPPGWLRVLSRSTGKIYFCYPETGETTFQEPTGPPPSLAVNLSLPAGWTQMESRSTGRTYYWHAELQKSQFDAPTEADSVAGGTPAVSAASLPVKAAAASSKLPAGWVELDSRSTGRKYYYNTESQVSQFERPV